MTTEKKLTSLLPSDTVGEWKPTGDPMTWTAGPNAFQPPDERAAFEAIAHWKDMTPFAWFQQGWKARAASTATATDGGYKRLMQRYERVLAVNARLEKYIQEHCAAAPQGALSDERILELSAKAWRDAPVGQFAMTFARTLLAEQAAAPMAGDKEKLK